MMARRMLAAAAVLVAGIAGSALAQNGAVSALSGEPGAPSAAAQPERAYGDACGTCHDRGGFGVQVLADRLGAERSLIHERNNLSPDAIRFIVRNGFGAMPAMSKVEVSDAELDRIIAYLGQARAPARPR